MNDGKSAIRTWISVFFLCLTIALAALFSGNGVTYFFGPSAAEVARTKEAYRADRNLLLLRLSICQSYAAKVGDAYICPGSTLIYQSLTSSADCQLAQETARELGIVPRDLSIAGKGFER